MTPERKSELQRELFEKGLFPALEGVERVNREDGVKLYMADGSWVICRFSGTEPLLRVCAESSTEEKARSCVDAFRAFLGV